MNMHLLHTLLTHFRALTEQDVDAILAGPSETLLSVLQQRYGYTRTQAQAAWNAFARGYVDGHGSLRHTGLPHGNRVVVAYPKPGLVGKRPLRRVHGHFWSSSVSSARLM